MIPLSVLDLSFVTSATPPRQALANSVDLAKHVDALGFARYWLAEHHSLPSVASSVPEIMIGQIAAVTKSIRVGSGGVMLTNHAPLLVAERFKMLEALFPGRIDLGLGRAPGTDQVTAYALRRHLEERPGDDFLEKIARADFEPPATCTLEVSKDERKTPLPGDLTIRLGIEPDHRVRIARMPSGKTHVVVADIRGIPAQHHVAKPKSAVDCRQELLSREVLATQDPVDVRNGHLGTLGGQELLLLLLHLLGHLVLHALVGLVELLTKLGDLPPSTERGGPVMRPWGPAPATCHSRTPAAYRATARRVTRG